METKKLMTWIVGLCVFMLFLNACNDDLEDTTFFTTDEMTIIGTLESNPEKFSLYLEILEKTEYYNALKSYGNYTCFAPTNEAILKYIQENFNANSIDELSSEQDIEFLKVLVKFHTMPSGRLTSSFIEGRLPDTTYTGDYLTTSFLRGGGISNVEINREVGLEQYDIRTNNGVIHAINGVMSPFVDPVPAAMEKAGKHNIFVEAMKQTGYYEIFSVIFADNGSKNNFTILAESDEVYAKEGINSFEDLVARISPSDSDFTNPDNDLNRYVGYHATKNFLYTADFPEDAFINTVLPRNAIKSFKTDKELRLNETETGVDDTWTSIITSESNYPSKNGVYHTVDKLFTIFVPKPKHIIFDVISDQPEYQSRLIRSHQKVPSTAWEFIRWFPEKDVRYLRQSKNSNIDHTVLDIAGVAWFEFDTPVIPKGKYEMLVMGNGGNGARAIFQIYFDGEPIGSVYNMTLRAGDIGWPDETLMDSRGWRLGYEEYVDNKGVSQAEKSGNSRFIVSRELLIPEQKRHVVRFETLKSGNSPIDFIEWIPVD
ncbi:putative surface protein with fasciclin (FAS1) repeats [Jejuia pallidilutea]|uniref:Putative surface protein with fasciclin (FAS1) repeats n=1 Tax=Jejuia pallidilutea TaxID=504487 RepID=A0A362X1G2_9FLAO|nr:fasciclin domain-containing protein [Jejuia pallidilutea]PQV48950.1 putative surface protein with fasciclin (FAS1) repeats [Jejuia pallidilutea]